jgi:hypothetical protein
MDIWKELWESIVLARAREKQTRERYMASLTPQFPHSAQRCNRSIMPRARAHLPAGMRKREVVPDA